MHLLHTLLLSTSCHPKSQHENTVQNWRRISSLNVDVKIISKALSKRLKNVPPSLISDDQSAYVDERFISEGRRLIADVLKTIDMLKLNGVLVTVDIQKAFDSVNHQFLILTLKTYGIVKMFIKWVKTLLNNQESCIINGGFTTKYFKLNRDTRQSDPISTYLFIHVLEIVFNLIKRNKDIYGSTFFDHTFLYTVYANDTTFFLKDKESVKKVMNVFDTFSVYSGLKPNKSKCGIAGFGVLKWVSMKLCGKACIDLTKNSVKILGIHFSYNKKTEDEENFIKLINKIGSVLRIWRIRNLTVQGKITIL